MRTIILIIFTLLMWHLSVGQKVWLRPNEGQWDDRIEYKVNLNLGELYVERDGFTYNLSDVKSRMSSHHDADFDGYEEAPYKFHVVKSKFLNSNWQEKVTESDKSTFYENYLIGNDQSKWKSSVYSYSQIRMHDLYDGVDLLIEGSEGFKYSFLLQPNASADQIKMNFEGQNSIRLDELGKLIVETRFGEIIEDAPIAWYEGEGKREYVDIEFRVENEVVSFSLPNGFDGTRALIIDPSLTFSTFTGSTADNWGMCATPDAVGNLFGGGVVFAAGYPVTVGAYDNTFNGGTIDIGITKFNDIGTALWYSTYIGGALGSETPNSIVCSETTDELFIFGVTSSTDFPMAGVPFDGSFNGGPSIPNSESNNLGFTDGSDLYVARLSADGSTLIASTFMGGSGSDGLNTSNLKFNYGDQFRGEIILDENDNVFVTSMTESTNFPTFLGAQGALNGTQDAVAFKMPPSLSTLNWSTYFGGGLLETGNSIQLSSTGDVFIAGGTNSANLPVFNGNDLTFNGGLSDGFVVQLDGTDGSNIAGTYMGLGEYDQTYFVQLDLDDKVYVFGQSESAWAITNGLYGNANSGQFIRKYSEDLLAIEWTTMIGAGTGNVEISPTAFLVSDCYDIYIAGWGGELNANPSVSQAVNSTSNGFPVTSGQNNAAYQPTTNGSNFYLAVLDQDAAFLQYGTFMGGTASPYNHVDGGTSRFDKSGRIYHAVCGSCGNGVNQGFTTTVGAWSETSNSFNCNMACFKFELNTIEAIVSDPDPYVCLPDPVVFTNNSTNGNFFFWDFGDNTTSTEENTEHVYPGPGDYLVTLVVTDTNGCFSPDSTNFWVHIGDFQATVDAVNGAICPGDSYQLEAQGGTTYAWSPAEFLDDSTLYNPTATLFETTEFSVIVSDSCGTDTVWVTVPVYINNTSISNDTSLCIGNSVMLTATGGGTYSWSPSTYLNDPNIASPTSTPDQNILYDVEIISPDGCVFNEDVQVNVYYDPPVPVIPDYVAVCVGQSSDITVSGAETYAWSPNINITPLTGPTVTISPIDPMYYYVDFTNACGTLIDSVYVDVVSANITAGNDTIICPGESAQLWAAGGVSYSWEPATSMFAPTGSSVIATPVQPTVYYVTGTDLNGCIGTASVFVDLFPMPYIQTNPDVYAVIDDEVQLTAWSATPGPYVWTPSEFLSCTVCQSPVATPNQNYTYIVTYTDANGCSASDDVTIHYDPFLYVPNTFTPDEDEFNRYFQAVGGNIKEFEMYVYNRWGELVYTMLSMEDFWDGTYGGVMAQDGTYVWKAIIMDYNDIRTIFTGHVNLLR